jgi:hypothetical protein
MYLTVALHTTVCPDTPDNWREFWRLKAALGRAGHRAPKPRNSAEFTQMLRRQVAAENKQLRTLRTYLPGREPDRL